MKKLLEKCFKIYVVVKYGINCYCWERNYRYERYIICYYYVNIKYFV